MLAWNEDKSARNKIKHGLAFDAVYDFEWETSIRIDRSLLDKDGEAGFAQIGWLYGKLYTIILTFRADVIRIISLRRANRKEERTYDQEN